jgi:hypothetical protein
VKRLLRPHREAVDQPDPLDPEHLGQQALLHPDIVGHREMRVAAAVERRRRVARRGGEAVAELVDDDDEVSGRIERPARRDQPFQIVMLGAVGGRVDDRVRFRGVERAVGLIGEPRVAVGQPRLQHDIAGLEDLVIGHDQAPSVLALSRLLRRYAPRNDNCFFGVIASEAKQSRATSIRSAYLWLGRAP